MADDMIGRLSEQVARRTFLRRATGFVFGLSLALIGVPQQAQAYNYACCHLCRAPSPSCSGCTCSWCWTCPWGRGYYQCCECYATWSGCTGGCTSNYCSWVEYQPCCGLDSQALPPAPMAGN